MNLKIIVALIAVIVSSPVSAAYFIGPIGIPTQAKAEAWKSTHEPEAEEDFIYEDNRMIIWFDFSSGGFPRGVWLKDGDGVLHSKNTFGQEVPVNLIFGGGYQLLIGPKSRPDSPSENFMIFFEKNPRPALSRGRYFYQTKEYTDIGFIGWLYNNSIKALPGFDPNKEPIKPEHYQVNPYMNESWPETEERWVHTSTDSKTHIMSFKKMKGDGTQRRASYRIRFRIYHDKMKYDSNVDVFLYNKPDIGALLLVMDTLHQENPEGNNYVKSLAYTGLNTASWDVAYYDQWFGIPPDKWERIQLPKGKTAVMRHTEKPDYPGNGATSFVTFKPQIRSPWIEIYNGNRDSSGKVTKGLDVVIRRDFTDLSDISHIGFTDTPWYDGTKFGNWWISNEIAFIHDGIEKNVETRSFSETVSFRRKGD